MPELNYEIPRIAVPEKSILKVVESTLSTYDANVTTRVMLCVVYVPEMFMPTQELMDEAIKYSQDNTLDKMTAMMNFYGKYPGMAQFVKPRTYSWQERAEYHLLYLHLTDQWNPLSPDYVAKPSKRTLKLGNPHTLDSEHSLEKQSLLVEMENLEVSVGEGLPKGHKSMVGVVREITKKLNNPCLGDHLTGELEKISIRKITALLDDYITPAEKSILLMDVFVRPKGVKKKEKKNLSQVTV